MSMSLNKLMLYFMLLSVFIKPAVSVNYFLLGIIGSLYLGATLLLGKDTNWFPGRGILAAMYILPFYLIQQTQYVNGYGWLILQNLLVIVMVLIIWRDESFLVAPYLSPRSPYRELDLAVPLAIFFYIASLIIIPAVGPRLVNWNLVQQDALLAFEGLFIYFVITRYFNKSEKIEQLSQYILIAYLAIVILGCVNLYNTFQSLNRARFFLKQDQVTQAADYVENTARLNRITRMKKVDYEIYQLKTSLVTKMTQPDSDN